MSFVINLHLVLLISARKIDVTGSWWNFKQQAEVWTVPCCILSCKIFKANSYSKRRHVAALYQPNLKRCLEC
jgi:hypothetical protein